MLGEAQHTVAAGIGYRLAEGGRQREAVLLGAKREALSAVSVRLLRHSPGTPPLQTLNTAQIFPTPSRAKARPDHPAPGAIRANCPMDLLSTAGLPGMEG